MDITELITTFSACWGILVVAGAGIVALPWSAEELVAMRGALSGCAELVTRWARVPAAPVPVLEAVVVEA